MSEYNSLNSNWRKIASTIYDKPKDSKIFGESELDITELEKYIAFKRKQGIKITLTHVFALIISKAVFTQAPQLNRVCG